MNYINKYYPDTVAHPGVDLSEKLDETEMGPKEFAVRTGKPEKTINAVLKGDSRITSDMAVVFENVLGIPARYWLNRQAQYDEYQSRLKKIELAKDAEQWAKRFRIRDMQKLGWLPNVSSVSEKVDSLFRFFGVSNASAWEGYYLNEELKVQFRISLAHTSQPESISAWLRQGELQAKSMDVPAYSEKDFRSSLIEIKKVMAAQPDNFLQRLTDICSSVGVKLVYTPCLPKAPISGATRWLGDTPLIQLSGRYRRNDSFWFTFFHEAGHVLLHGKKDVFLEEIDYSAKDENKETEANAFAVKWTLSEDEEDEILNNCPLSRDQLIQYAEKFSTHPGIIIGRFHHKKLIHYSEHRDFIVSLNFD